MHFKGAGVSADRARGVAWLALAAERGDPPLADALEWGYAQLTPEEVARANAIWRDELKPRYGDAVAMPRAMSLWRMDLVMTTGSHLGYTIGPLEVTDYSTGETIDGMTRQRRLREQGGPYANPVYPRVEVGDLVSLESKRRR
jgi:TPR repeat protein